MLFFEIAPVVFAYIGSCGATKFGSIGGRPVFPFGLACPIVGCPEVADILAVPFPAGAGVLGEIPALLLAGVEDCDD
jgi:hypothetical protein